MYNMHLNFGVEWLQTC